MTTSDPTRPGENQPGTDPEKVRIGDADRNAAVDALGEHMTTGRLDLDEYGTRSALANTARTVGDLHALFTDLPAPHPVLPGDRAVTVPARRPISAAPVTATTAELQAMADDRSRMQKLVGAAAASSGIIALVLFFATGQWWWFLLVPLISTIAGSVWGDGWKRPDHR